MARHLTSRARGIANPLALMSAAALMLDHADKMAAAGRLRAALDTVLLDPATRTRDLRGTATTEQFTQAVIDRITGD